MNIRRCWCDGSAGVAEDVVTAAAAAAAVACLYGRMWPCEILHYALCDSVPTRCRSPPRPGASGLGRRKLANVASAAAAAAAASTDASQCSAACDVALAAAAAEWIQVRVALAPSMQMAVAMFMAAPIQQRILFQAAPAQTRKRVFVSVTVIVIEATEIVSRWEKKKKKDCSGARPHNRLGPVGPF
jgi:hypothetical protein